MKKIVSSATLGGAPIYKSDLREIFNDEIWDILEVNAPFIADDEQGVIMNGCVITPNAGTPANFDITGGIIALDGEYLRLPAATNKVFPQFIAKKTTSYETRTFADGTTNNFIEIKEAELVSSAPVSGQYIIIADFHVNNRWNMPWTSVSLINSWTGTLEYRIVRGIVELKGTLAGTSASGNTFSSTNSGSPAGLNSLPQSLADVIILEDLGLAYPSRGFMSIRPNTVSVNRGVSGFRIDEDPTTPPYGNYILTGASYRQKKWTAADL